MSGLEVQTGPSKPGVTGIVTKRDDDDPADYLLKNTKYHDCKITVTDPVSKEVEDFGVVSSDLAAHSLKLRGYLEDNKNDIKLLKIDDISPNVFRIMLKFIYGGKLPDMDRATAAQLALGGMIYGVKKLVTKASKKLVPTSVEDVLPAMFIVAHNDQSFLLPQVTKIVQEKTDALLKKDQFLELDQKCIEFIVAQEKLAVPEIDLWKSLVKWAKEKVRKGDEKSLRDILGNSLTYIRFASMNESDIIKEVMPQKILSSGEITDLLFAVSNNLMWDCAGMCKNNKQRELPTKMVINRKPLVVDYKFYQSHFFTFNDLPCPTYGAAYGKTTLSENPDYKTFSALTISTHQKIQISTVTFQTRSLSRVGDVMYNMSCSICFSKSTNGFCTDSKVCEVGGAVFCDNEIQFALKLQNGGSLVLDAHCLYYICIQFSTEHPVFKLGCTSGYDPTGKEYKSTGMIIKPLNELHLKQFSYKT